MMQHFIVGQREEAIGLIRKGLAKEGFLSCITEDCLKSLIHVKNVTSKKLHEMLSSQIKTLKKTHLGNDVHYRTVIYFDQFLSELGR